MSTRIRKAIAEGTITLGSVSLPCAVLDDESRVLSERGMSRALGIKRGGAHWRRRKAAEGAHLPVYLSATNLKPYISNDLEEMLLHPLVYKPLHGGAHGNGILGRVYPAICRVWADALEDGALHPSQIHIGMQAAFLSKGLDEVAIVALIDEATNYQRIRAGNALQEILSAYILPEHRPWLRKVPPAFEQEVYRVFGWKYSADHRGPRYAGKLIRKLIYEQMPNPILPELDKRNPANEKWQRKRRHHQHLTTETGLEHFRALISGVTALLRATPDNNKRNFWRLFERAYGKQMRLEIDDDDDPTQPTAP